MSSRPFHECCLWKWSCWRLGGHFPGKMFTPCHTYTHTLFQPPCPPMVDPPSPGLHSRKPTQGPLRGPSSLPTSSLRTERAGDNNFLSLSGACRFLITVSVFWPCSFLFFPFFTPLCLLRQTCRARPLHRRGPDHTRHGPWLPSCLASISVSFQGSKGGLNHFFRDSSAHPPCRQDCPLRSGPFNRRGPDHTRRSRRRPLALMWSKPFGGQGLGGGWWVFWGGAVKAHAVSGPDHSTVAVQTALTVRFSLFLFLSSGGRVFLFSGGLDVVRTSP